MELILLIAAACALAPAAPWGVPALALAAAGYYLGGGGGAGMVIAVLCGAAVPLTAGLAGALLDAACRGGPLAERRGRSRLFETLALVLAGAALFRSPDAAAAMGAVVRLSRSDGALVGYEAAARWCAAIYFCGGLTGLVCLGAAACSEIPLRFTLGAARVRVLDAALGALRPFVFIAVLGGVFHLAAALCAHEFAQLLGGGAP